MRIIVYGMSCVGKTTFAKQFSEYLCFDSMFHWNEIELLGLSPSNNLLYIKDKCDQLNSFILDGWSLVDSYGKLYPSNTKTYLIYADYHTIINQYKITVSNYDMYKHMYNRWYKQIDYTKLDTIFIKNDGISFKETKIDQFLDVVKLF